MPGKGHKFSAKDDRMASHVAQSERSLGESPETAKRIGYATMNKWKGRSAKRKGKRATSKR